MRRFGIEWANGHALIDMDGARTLVDTGSPFTLCADGTIALAGRTFAASPSLAGVTAATIGEQVGTPIDVVLGMDVLGEFDVELDARAGTLGLAEALETPRGTRVPLRRIGGVPACAVTIGGEEVYGFLDTGATICYVPDAAVADLEPVGEHEDFYPGFGRFRSALYDCGIDIAERRLCVRSGVLPSGLALLLTLAGSRAILGMPLLRAFRVSLCMRRESVYLDPLPNDD